MIKDVYQLIKSEGKEDQRKIYERPWKQFFNIQRANLENFLLFQDDEDPAYAKRLRGIMDRLGQQGFTRVLLSPELTFNLGKRKWDKTFIMGIFEVEGIREGLDLGLTSSGWSALGDYCLLEKREFLRSPNRQNIIPLDFYGPWVSADDDDCVPYDEKDMHLLTREFNQALELIRQADRAIYDFVVMSTSVIQIRKNPKRTYTYSTENYTGRVFFTNPLDHYGNTLGLAGGIYHEAIHNYLYITERFQHLIKDRSYREQEIISPWTGNKIQTHSFMHATFVWYGLWKFHQETQLIKGHELDSRRRVNEASFGFRKNCAIHENLQQDFRPKAHPEFIWASERMQEDILKAERGKWPQGPFRFQEWVTSSLEGGELV